MIGTVHKDIPNENQLVNNLKTEQSEGHNMTDIHIRKDQGKQLNPKI